MEKYIVSLYDEHKGCNSLIVSSIFYNADEADAWARKCTKRGCDWARVYSQSEGISTIYKKGRIMR